MVLAHGYGCDQDMWRLITPEFENDYRLILFDYVGHGQSDASAFSPHRYASLEGYAADILDICEVLAVRDAIFVGHSVSCMVGVLAARKDPSRFESLIMVGPSPRYINDVDYTGGFSRADIDDLIEFLDSNHLGWSRTMAPVIMGNPDRPHLSTELQSSFCRMDPEVAKHFARVTFNADNRDDLKDVAIPCLVLQCRDDAIAPEVVGEYVHQNIPGSQFVLLGATGHCPHLSSPRATTEAMRAFLDSYPRRTPRSPWS